MIANMDILQGLNEQQKKAVVHIDGPLLVIAGAGAGKTKVITHRIANLVKNKTQPEQILAVTFTNKAANEMKERVFQLLKSEPKPDFGSFSEVRLRFPIIGTFHSVCARILRENSRAIKRPRNFSILNKEDSLKITKKCLKNLQIDPKQFQPAKIQAIISRQKSELVNQKSFSDSAGEDFFPKTLALIWQEYEKMLEKQKALDFDDLIAKTVFLFKQNQNILEEYQNKWRYILVDEYQDTNRAQYVLIKLLAQKHQNICVVGDEDQSIYSFRGANFGNILNFENDWRNTTTVMLEQNYRSAQKILDAANAVIKRNKSRKPKNLFSSLEQGEDLTIFDAFSEHEEAEFVVSTCHDSIMNGTSPSEIAVLYRANFQSRILEEACLKYDIPYQVIGTKFFDRKEVRDIVAYLKASLNLDDHLSLERIISEPPRGIGKSSLMRYLAGKNLSTITRISKIKDFFGFLQKIKKVSEKEKLSKTLIYIMKNSGYQDHLDNGSEDGMMRIENLKELVSLSIKYDQLKPETAVERFLEDVSLLSDQDIVENKSSGATQGRVRLMTVHAAKGLEFPFVFIIGLEDGLFPFKKFDFSSNDEEEERRLFYVAMTRAKERLFLSFARSRNYFGGKQTNKPSQFLNEIPEELINKPDEISETNYLEI